MAKIRVRLSNAEASIFGFELKPHTSEGNARYSLNDTQLKQLNEMRNKGVINACDSLSIDPTAPKHLWIKDKNTSAFVPNPLYKDQTTKDYDILKDNILKEISKKAPIISNFKHEPIKDGHCLVVSPADIHIGKLATAFETGKDYNSQIAVKRTKEGIKSLLNKAYGFGIDKIILIIGNDILHTDNPKRCTTSGTPQDTDGMWYENFLIAKQLYCDVILELLAVAPVEVVYNPSNHDYVNGFFLAQVIEAYFKNTNNVTFKVDISHRKYTIYGNSLIGSTHGDGAKQTDLGSLMSIEAKEHWVHCDFRYFYTHHLHHKTAKDYINVTVETLRSPSTADSWHSRNGYVNQPAIEAFLHSKDKGQVARFTHYF